MKRKRIARGWLPWLQPHGCYWWKWATNSRDRLISREMDKQERLGIRKWVCDDDNLG